MQVGENLAAQVPSCWRTVGERWRKRLPLYLSSARLALLEKQLETREERFDMADLLHSGEEVTPDGLGAMPPVGNVDPGGLQSSSTVSTATGLALVAASSSGDTVDSLLRLGTHPMEVMTAGLSMASIGHMSAFTAGLVLIGIGILLNVSSLVIRWQNRYADIRNCQQWCRQEIERKVRSLSSQGRRGDSGPL
jgi:hypothetical protein